MDKKTEHEMETTVISGNNGTGTYTGVSKHEGSFCKDHGERVNVRLYSRARNFGNAPHILG